MSFEPVEVLICHSHLLKSFNIVCIDAIQDSLALHRIFFGGSLALCDEDLLISCLTPEIYNVFNSRLEFLLSLTCMSAAMFLFIASEAVLGFGFAVCGCV